MPQKPYPVGTGKTQLVCTGWNPTNSCDLIHKNYVDPRTQWSQTVSPHGSGWPSSSTQVKPSGMKLGHWNKTGQVCLPRHSGPQCHANKCLYSSHITCHVNKCNKLPTTISRTPPCPQVTWLVTFRDQMSSCHVSPAMETEQTNFVKDTANQVMLHQRRSVMQPSLLGNVCGPFRSALTVFLSPFASQQTTILSIVDVDGRSLFQYCIHIMYIFDEIKQWD